MTNQRSPKDEDENIRAVDQLLVSLKQEKLDPREQAYVRIRHRVRPLLSTDFAALALPIGALAATALVAVSEYGLFWMILIVVLVVVTISALFPLSANRYNRPEQAAAEIIRLRLARESTVTPVKRGCLFRPR